MFPSSLLFATIISIFLIKKNKRIKPFPSFLPPLLWNISIFDIFKANNIYCVIKVFFPLLTLRSNELAKIFSTFDSVSWTWYSNFSSFLNYSSSYFYFYATYNKRNIPRIYYYTWLFFFYIYFVINIYHTSSFFSML